MIPEPFNPIRWERLQWRNEAQRRVYASWDAYDAALRVSSYWERHVKTLAEVAELERWWAL